MNWTDFAKKRRGILGIEAIQQKAPLSEAELPPTEVKNRFSEPYLAPLG
jgi:hypothetical protein